MAHRTYFASHPHPLVTLSFVCMPCIGLNENSLVLLICRAQSPFDVFHILCPVAFLCPAYFSLLDITHAMHGLAWVINPVLQPIGLSNPCQATTSTNPHLVIGPPPPMLPPHPNLHGYMKAPLVLRHFIYHPPPVNQSRGTIINHA